MIDVLVSEAMEKTLQILKTLKLQGISSRTANTGLQDGARGK